MGFLGVVGYRLGGVSGKGRHGDVCEIEREREGDKDIVEWGGSLVGWNDLWMCVFVCVRERERVRGVLGV